MKRLILLLFALAMQGSMALLAEQSSADGPGCNESVDMYSASEACVWPAGEVIAMASSGDGYRYRVEPRCSEDATGTALCFEQATCRSEDGTQGLWYDLLRNGGSGWERYGQVCLTDQQAAQLGAITPGMVLQAMRALTWPKSALSVQPPDGETLVNFETNFFTTNTEPTTQTVTLLGQRVEIEATPSSYLWHWGGQGEDGGSDKTSTAGHAYPKLEVVHVYRQADRAAHPRVDTVYSGRYRVNGGGWRAIPGTLTVSGDAVDLTVLEARPVLVGH